ncbi:MAG TPA: A/G-specific adenine glycosylase [Mycobacteriales bacterium]|nr:A/G-specific adenine glycosylase [Mycobacteriales bacterium]
MNDVSFAAAVGQWYDANARDLPWRGPHRSPWGVLVSEIMLQQTPVSRVLPAWGEWMARWPTPAALAADSPGEAVRAWGRLGYPRRALRLHAAAVAIVEQHGGSVPSAYDDLLALPGVGTYTAAAVAAFGFGAHHAVLDTNVRRVLARVFDATADAPGSAPTASELRRARALIPPGDAAHHAVAVMELGALICTARTPRCTECPVVASCRWWQAGRPPAQRRRAVQRYAGTDRQVRGRLLAVLRDAEGSVARNELDAVWDDDVQRERALAGLLADGLVQATDTGAYRLPA